MIWVGVLEHQERYRHQPRCSVEPRAHKNREFNRHCRKVFEALLQFRVDGQRLGRLITAWPSLKRSYVIQWTICDIGSIESATKAISTEEMM